MIAYFDTSAIVPLIIDEPSSELCERIWNEATRTISIRLLYAEARAALARAERLGRLEAPQHAEAIRQLDVIVSEIDQVEITTALVHAAGELAQSHQLRGYDGTHLAAACSIANSDVVLVTGDSDLAAAASTLVLSVGITS